MTFSSPWSLFSRALCLPDNCGCEYVNLEAWIAQPSAFWSSLFHLIFAIVLYMQVKKKNQRLRLWVFSLILLAFASLFGHGSFLEFAMATDFAGIVLVISFFAAYEWLSKKFKSTAILVTFLLTYQIGRWFTFYSLNKWTKFSICLVIFALAMLELVRSEGRAFLQARHLHYALGILMISFGFFLMDELKVMCDPHSWLSGHTIWHFGTGLTLYYYGKYRFREL
jgi:hypothetical protein